MIINDFTIVKKDFLINSEINKLILKSLIDYI